MTVAEAAAFLSPVVDPTLRVWADLGAGNGTFTAALASLLSTNAAIYAVDIDEAALQKLQSLWLPPGGATVIPVRGSIDDLSLIPELEGVRFNGALLANVLHYFADPAAVLMDVRARLQAAGRVLVVEYDRALRNQWVPYPIPTSRLSQIAEAAGLTWQGVAASQPSRYQGTLYCGYLVAESAEST
jgi:SAM-dependent methyltransferase